MNKKELGKSGIYVSPLAFGGNVFGWTIDEKRSFEVLDAFFAAGYNFIDTADVYSRWAPGNKGGESETIIGKWMKQKGSRDKMIIATKVGSDMGQGKKDISKKYILKAIEDSLKRLQTDYIDLYQTHWDDAVTPVEETLDAYTQLIKEGKIRAAGASNLSPGRLKESLAASAKNNYTYYQSFQPEYNLYSREGFEKELQAICVENNIGAITYYSLASGFLTGKYRSENDLNKSARGGGIRKFLNERGYKILAALDKIAGEYKSSPAAISLAWLMARPAVVSPIASATTTEQLTSLLDAAKIQFSEESIRLLDEASSWK